MIEKLKETQMESQRYKIVQKLNEVIDAINPILEERESGIKVYEETMEMVKQNTLEDRMIGCDTLEIPPTYKTAIQRAAESANKNLDNALTVAVDALTYMRNNCLEYAADYMDKADEALTKIAAILKVRQKD